jgi:hypothetical protein
LGFPRLTLAVAIVLAAQCRRRRCRPSGGLMFHVVVIRAPREVAVGNVGRLVERFGSLALPADIGCLARRTGRAVATMNERYRDW